jgi:hypothetical protein
MKQVRLFLMVGMMALVATSCEDEYSLQKTIDFEDVALGAEGYYNGSDKTGEEMNGSWVKYIRSNSAEFINQYGESAWGAFWSGFSISSLKDTVTPGFGNQYSTVAGSGATGSVKFALAYDSAVVLMQSHLADVVNPYARPKSLMITNSTYTYRTIKEGDLFTSKFEAGDWYKIIIRGYKSTEQTGLVEYYLADFREGKSLVFKDWKKVDLSGLGEVDRIVFTFDSSDKTAGWLNTPAYACIDNLILAYSEK